MTDSEVQKLYSERTDDLGVVRLERWPEGFVLWAGGMIRWKSWTDESLASASCDENPKGEDRLRAECRRHSGAVPTKEGDAHENP